MRLYGVTAFLLTGLCAPALWSASSVDPSGGKTVRITNFHQVNDHIYRGAQPSAGGFEDLAKIGVKTVIDLRDGETRGRDGEKKLVEGAGMHYVHVPLAGFGAPKDEQIGSLLSLLDDSSAWPVFVHCKRGADRTGTVVACYRISHDHWDNEKALSEARIHGLSILERAMHEYIVHFEKSGKPTLPHAELKTNPATP